MENNCKYYAHQLDDLIAMYAEVCEWFNGLGVSYSKNRYGLYKQHFNEFTRLAEDSNRLESEELFCFKQKFDNAYLEVNEIIRIYNNLKEIDSGEFLAQIKKISSGQEFRGNSDNDQARDFLFELSVASRFIKAGFEVSLSGVCDVVVDLAQDGALFVECKRIKSKNKIGSNIKKANKQISCRISTQASSKVRGLVAINVTDLLPKTNILIPNSLQSGTAIHRGASNNFIRQHLDVLSSGMHGKSLGVMCESAMMSYLPIESENPGLFYSRHTEFIPYSQSQLFEKLAPRLSRQDIK